MEQKRTHIRPPSEHQPSRRAVTIFVALLVIAVGAFAYYCYQLVERQTVVQQSVPVTPITTPEPQASPSVAASNKRASQVYPPPVEITTPEPQEYVASEPTTPVPPASQYRCDGRTRCSQMTSCDEAKFFLRTCPGTQMDGDSDGIPCEQQWCGN